MFFNGKNITTKNELIQEMKKSIKDNINRDDFDTEESYQKALKNEFEELYQDMFRICIDMENNHHFFFGND